MSEATPPSGAPYVRGTLYLGIANWVSYAINFAVTLAIARMLGPASFGLYAFVAAINEFIRHYHAERHHQGLDSRLIEPDGTAVRSEGSITCRERLGGMLRHDYREAA